MSHSHEVYEEDEIDLRELFRTLKKRRFFILGITFVITVLAMLYAYLKTPIYEVKSHVQIGFINTEKGTQLIIEPKTAVRRLHILYNLDDKLSTGEKFISEVSSIEVNKKIPNFVTIKTEAISNTEGIKLNKQVVNDLVAEYKPKVDDYILGVKNQILDVKRQIEQIEVVQKQNLLTQIDILKNQKIAQINEKIKFLKNEQTKTIQRKINFHKKNLKEYKSAITELYRQNQNSKDQTATMITSIQMVNYQNLILSSQNTIENLNLELSKIREETVPNLKRDKAKIINDDIRKLNVQIDVTLKNKVIKLNEEVKSLEYKLLPQNVQNSQQVGDFIIHDYAMKPKKKLIVVVAFITGLILSIFLVFFLEFIRSVEEDEKNLEKK